MTNYVDGKGQAVVLARTLGRGGQGTVYAVLGRRDTVAKIYLNPPDQQTARKLDALAKTSDTQLLSVSAWPQSVLKDHTGKVQGFVMPLVDASDFQELHMLYRIAARRQSFPNVDGRFLVHVARNVARGFAVLHMHGHLMGDVSSRNVMVSRGGTVRFIDTDSFQIKLGSETYPCPVGTPEFTPPELQGKALGKLLRTADHDLFGLASLIFHLLFDGRHPYAGVHDNKAAPSLAEAIAADQFAYSLKRRTGVKPPPATLRLSSLHLTLQDFFERAFSPVHRNRPAASEWETVLADLSKHLTPCRNKPSHWHDRRMPCPECLKNQGVPTQAGVPPSAQRINVEVEIKRIWLAVQAVPMPLPPQEIIRKEIPEPFQISDWPPLSDSLLDRIWNIFSSGSLEEQRKRRYREQLIEAKGQHQYKIESLGEKIAQSFSHQQNQSAQARYKTAIKELEGLRREVQVINQEEQQELRSQHINQQQDLLSQYLAQQIIGTDMISGVGPGLIATLNQHGVSNAKHITPQIDRIKGVGPKRQQDLRAWRADLERKFRSTSAPLSPQATGKVQISMDRKRAAKLKVIEAAVVQLKNDLPRWKNAELPIADKISELQFELARHQKTLDLIEKTLAGLS
ncbi:hypothetical protein EHF33_20365 (plasmid) [Deinococcus psychrotolerans]|uniref:Protein kinase domain-containing protein n=1 Tax=Deinococcus psychrotolerans TaxID=2489213 RepID=A0A3G8YJ41_9DEIO|nr:protein kinase [Deinococcus psychrotolerans]AZI45262.1 hypothetical protein EHF33_20365 [Deinococcus psychrotolerans]